VADGVGHGTCFYHDGYGSAVLDAVRSAAGSLLVLARAGVIRPMGLSTLRRTAAAQRYWGRSFAGAVAANAVRYGEAEAIVDDRGAESFTDLHRRSNGLANLLAGRGLGEGSTIGLLGRDSREFIEAIAACSKLGANLLLLNTGFSAPQLRDVLDREEATAVVHDEEFDAVVHEAAGDRVLVATNDFDALLADADDADPPAPAEQGRQIVLTSGTTGTPKGARRPRDTPVDAVTGFLSRVPLRARRTHFVVAPMFHAWGFAHMGLGLMLGCRIVVRRRFDPEATLAAIERHQVDSAAMVPVMAQRILELPADVQLRHDCSSLRVVALGGSAIPGDLAVRFMDAFGDVAYNTYGSTEVAVVSVAGPRDLREAPHTAGRPVPRVVVRLLDDGGRPVPDGEAGRIFVGSAAAFEGYTGGGGKEILDGLMSTGDMGRFDAGGRLNIEGRDDDMIVSGGENVFPREVEDVIGAIDGVREVAVIGVPDDDFGQRLHAVVVRADGAQLTADDVKQAVRGELARYKVPRDVVFADELPRTTTGKILKRELAPPDGPAR
jgi:acyl-CoA synthetase (AMP-forming)/AMP-acid ligase II